LCLGTRNLGQLGGDPICRSQPGDSWMGRPADYLRKMNGCCEMVVLTIG